MSKTERLTLLSLVAGGIAGWSVNTGVNILSDTATTHLYGISIFLGVIVGLLWDIANKLNKSSTKE
jgi:hypothetical protein